MSARVINNYGLLRLESGTATGVHEQSPTDGMGNGNAIHQKLISL